MPTETARTWRWSTSGSRAPWTASPWPASSRRSVPVVLLTGDYARAATEGRDVAAEVLIKPVTAEVLLATVGDVAERRGRDG